MTLKNRNFSFLKITDSIGASACLLGSSCNYKAQGNLNFWVRKLKEEFSFSWELFCPEDFVMGTPREPVNIVGGTGADVWEGTARVLTHKGEDVTALMKKGAIQFEALLRRKNIRLVILKEKSPSCGVFHIYDGTLWPEKKLIKGQGVTSAFLSQKGYVVLSDQKEAQDFYEYACERWR
ncbi:MAG: DUF523 domain-containing protein [Bdellovibrio sp.]|nr:MAG: DUF523 domain-containing protein [Bdellovibrio sp.]